MSATDSEFKKIESGLEKLIHHSGGIDEINNFVGGFNIFEAIGHTRREERHSDFLSYLLDPNKDHNLGVKFVSRLAKTIKAKKCNLFPELFDKMAANEFEKINVNREYNLEGKDRIDILCLNKSPKYYIAIENKVASKQGRCQLKKYRKALESRYPKHERLLIYLTPKEDRPDDKPWHWIGYGDILSIVDTLYKEYNEELDKAVSLALHHYARMLEKDIVTNDELIEKADTVYRNHKKAFDYVFKMIDEKQKNIFEFLAEITKKEGKIEPDHSTIGIIRFFPTEWKDIKNFCSTPKDKWTKSRRSILFEIHNRKNLIFFVIAVGPMQNETSRNEIIEFCRNDDKFSSKDRSSAGGQFARIHSETIIEKSDIEKMSLSEIKKEIEKWFEVFLTDEFPYIVESLANKFRH